MSIGKFYTWWLSAPLQIHVIIIITNNSLCMIYKNILFAPRFFTMIIVSWVDLVPKDVWCINESGLYGFKQGRTKLAYASS